MKNFLALFLIAVFMTLGQTAYAVKPASGAAEKAEKTLSKKELKKQERLEKRLAKAEKKAAASDVDFEDPVDKWMWFWIFGWGANLALSVVSIIIGIPLLGTLGYLAGVFGTVSLIIWLIKKFS